jgi:hypothetical protein
MKKKAPITANVFYLKSDKIILIFIGLFASLLYFNTLFNEYNLDDELVTLNHRLTSKGISAIPEIFTSPYYEDEMGYKFEYRPVTLTTFAIEHELFGESPVVSHLINVLLYVATVLMLYVLWRLLLPGLNIVYAVVTCLVFAAHPLHTEVVANIKNRDELLSLFFGLTAWYGAIRYIMKSSGGYVWLLLMLISFGLSMLSKQSGISMAALIPVSIVYFFRPQRFKLLIITIPLALVAVVTSPIALILHRAALFIGFVVSPFMFLPFFDESILPAIRKYFSERLSIKGAQDQETQPAFSFFFRYHFSVLQGIIIFLLAGAVLLISAKFGWVALGYFPLMIFFILTLINSNRQLANWILPALMATATLLYQWNNTGCVYTPFLIYFFLITLPGNGYSQISVYLSALIMILYVAFTLDNAVIPYALFLIIFLIRRHAKTLLLILIIEFVKLIGAIVNGFLEIQSKGQIEPVLYGEFAASFTAVATLILFLFTQKRQAAFYFLILALAGIFTYYHYIQLPNMYYATPIPKINQASANILPEFNRPILFQEMPLGFDAALNEKVGTALYVMAEYLKLLIIPHPLSFYYGYAEIVPVGLDNIQSVVSLLVHLALLLVALIFIRKMPVMSFGIIFYLSSIFVFSNLFYPVAGMMADRFAYIASVGFCMAFVFLLLKLFKIPVAKDAPVVVKPTFLVFFILLITAYSVKTIIRNAQWKNHLTLMRHDIKHLDKSAQAHNLLARNLMKYSYYPQYAHEATNMHHEALYHFKKSADIYSDFVNVWYDMGQVYLLLNDKENAFVCFKKAHQLDTTFTPSAINAAILAEEKKDYSTAITLLESAIRNNLQPEINVYDKLSQLYYLQGKFEKFIAVNKEALQHFPHVKALYLNIALVYREMKDTVNANFYQAQAEKIK